MRVEIELYRIWWESAREGDHSEDQGVDVRMGLEWILGRVAGMWNGSNWIRIGTGGGLL
jgi:hypothetical protein